MKYTIVALTILAFYSCSPSDNKSNESVENATMENSDSSAAEQNDLNGVSFVNISNGATLTSPFVLEMAIAGMQVEPKGEPREGYGHHHLLINDTFVPAGVVIVADETHIHYGGGQVTDSVYLDPGTYQLTLQFADGMHVSYGKKWSKTIQVNVQ